MSHKENALLTSYSPTINNASARLVKTAASVGSEFKLVCSLFLDNDVQFLLQGKYWMPYFERKKHCFKQDTFTIESNINIISGNYKKSEISPIPECCTGSFKM